MRDQSDISNYSDNELDIVNCLINGRNEITPKTAKEYFEKALAKSKAILNTSQIGKALYLESISELAENEYDIQKRSEIWENLFKKTVSFLNEATHTEDNLIHYSDIIISYIQEPFISKDFQDLKRGLSILKGKLDGLITHQGVSNSLELLIKKASILRSFSSFQATQEAKKQMLEKALRCVEKAISISDNTWYSHLELGNCLWFYSTFESKINSYNERITLAEASFKQSQDLKCTIQNTLALCRLYKDTFQISPFLAAFNIYEKIEKNKRRFLQNSFHLAESTIRMYYSKFPDEILAEYLTKSVSLLNDAISAGYNDARIITDLAFIKAAQGEISVGEHILKALKTSSVASFDWNIIIQDIKTILNSNDLFSKGFVLGIDDAGVWNKLGTFAITFLQDIDLGLRMYDVALHFDSKNPIVLTNISRALLKTTLDQSKLDEAEFKISQAASASTFRFQWWRQVREEVEAAKNQFNKTQPTLSEKQKFNLGKIADLYKYYLHLKEMNDPQARGFDFEKLIAAYFQISLGNAISSHRIKSATIEQIDAAFHFDKSYYRVEAKWTKDKTDHTDISDFYFKLKTVGVRGLIISINGFTNAAIERAKSLKGEVMLLMMDGEEIETTLKGSPSFDEAIRLKQLYFYYEDNPYYKINTIGQNI